MNFRQKISEYRHIHSEKKLLKAKDYNMLKAFQRNKCIFIHIPKNGGISVSNSLFGNLAWGHRDVQYYQRVFGRKNFNQFYKFTFVRNPYDRVYSAYRFLKNGGINEQDLKFSEKVLKPYESFDQFVKEGLRKSEVINWVHFKPQTEFLLDRNGKLNIDFVGKFENLNSDFQIVANHLNIDTKLEHLNKTAQNKTEEKEVFTAELKNIIKEVYYSDFKYFYPNEL